MKWFSKKHGNKVTHFSDKKVERDISPQDLSTSIDVLDELTVPGNDDVSIDMSVHDDSRKVSFEGIEDLSGEQREMIENYVGSPIVLVYSTPLTDDKPYFLFDNHQGWLVLKSEEEANNEVKKKLKFNLINNPDLFDQTWLDQFRMITMSPEQRDKHSVIEAKRFTSHASKKELENLAHSFGLHVNVDLPLEEIRDKVRSGIQKELKHQLQDPVEFYVNMEGRYTESELAKMPWVETKLDINGAVKDAIDMNGRAHFLSTVDGREIKLGDMFLYRME